MTAQTPLIHPAPQPRRVLAVTIPGPPVGKGRPRVANRGGRAMAYTPKRTRAWEAMAVKEILRHWHRDPIDCPAQITVVAVHQRPKRLMRKKDPTCRMWHPSKPDTDNVGKAAADAIQTAGVICDDARLCRWSLLDVYTAIGEAPCVEITVALLPEFPDAR